MIDLYYAPTPNGWKISIMLEELGLPYNVIPVNIREGDQFKPEFLAISPNNRIPAIIDRDGPGGAPYSLFESGARAFAPVGNSRSTVGFSSSPAVVSGASAPTTTITTQARNELRPAPRDRPSSRQRTQVGTSRRVLGWGARAKAKNIAARPAIEFRIAAKIDRRRRKSKTNQSNEIDALQ